jgi:cytochrome c oxidase assembly protein subunit 11
MAMRTEDRKMLGKLAVVVAGMFAFGYALIPLYKHICELTGINILALGEKQVPGASSAAPNSQVDRTRTITVEFDANARGPWTFKPAQASVQVHPGELATVMYEFQNVQDHRMAAQAIPSYATRQTTADFHQTEWFCFTRADGPRPTSTSWSASASTSTRWSRAKRNNGRWHSSSTRSCRRT